MLAEDIKWRHVRTYEDQTVRYDDHHLKLEIVRELEKIMNKSGRSVSEFNFIPPSDLTSVFACHRTLVTSENDYDIEMLKAESELLMSSLNGEQQKIFSAVRDSVDRNEGGFYFVYGSGGTGKTFLWKAIITYFRAEGKIVLAVASSGIASLLLPGGRTVHSQFKIPLIVDDNSTCNISKQSPLGQLLKSTDLIIWDEAPMMHRNALEAFEKSLQDIMQVGTDYGPSMLFGGKTVLLGGDFRQTLPVVQKGTRDMVVSASISNSYLWAKCKVFILRTNMRLQRSTCNPREMEKVEKFAQWVLDIGDGKLDAVSIDGDDDPSWITIPSEYLIDAGDCGLKNMVDIIYPDLHSRLPNKEYFRTRCVLATTNVFVEEINSYVLSQINGELRSYFSADSISPSSEQLDDQHTLYPTEFLNTLKISGLPNNLLQLKIGVPIMLLRNLNQRLGLCNGTRLIVTQLAERVIEAEIIIGTNIGTRVLIPRIILTSADTKWPFVLRRRQFPLKVCFSMTINKSQGQTLENIGIYLPLPVFSHGQLYVAVSRTSSYQGIKFLIGQLEGGHRGLTKNIVYKEVFNSLSG